MAVKLYGPIKVPTAIDLTSSKIGIAKKAIDASDEVGSLHEAPDNAKLNLLAERT